MSKILTCQICNQQFKILGHHIKRKHNLIPKDYYDIFFKAEREGICSCGKETKFFNLTYGYANHCSSKCSNNNRIVKDKQIKSYRKTLEDNPSITQKKVEKYKLWCKDNLEKVKNRTEKIKQIF
jgi:hypothetical protein